MHRRNFIKSTFGIATILPFSKSFDNLYSFSHSKFEVENLVIGSGYGGAVAALRLTEAGKKVTMVEMGLDWGKNMGQYKPFSNMIFPKNNSTWLHKSTVAPIMNFTNFNKKFTGVLDRMDFENIKIYAGRGVGGGSLVNGGMAVQPNRDYFQEILPELDANKFWEYYFPLAKHELLVNQIHDEYYQKSKYYKFSRVGEAEAHHAGFKTVKVPNVYSFDYMEKEEKGIVPKSALNGEVIYGNNYGKNSLDKTYLQKALSTGLLTIYDLHKVTAIKKDNNGGYIVKIDVIDVSGNIVEQKTFYCKRLFLNAGSIGSTKLLLTAKHNNDLPDLNEWVGKLWGNNGNIMCGRNMVNTIFNKVDRKSFNSFLGVGTNAKQSAIPVAGIDNWNDKLHCFFAEISPLPMNLEVYTALYLLINRIPLLSSISYNSLSNDIDVNWTQEHSLQPLTNAKYFVKALNKANGGTRAGLLFNGGFGADICYHPLGGIVLGKATDNFGRVNGYEHLFVTDGSLIPGTIGVNPFLTITAIAEYCIENILKIDF